MHESLDQRWRQLTEHYAQMWDDELLNLAADYDDLTDTAKQVLRDEMRKRNLGDPSVPRIKPAQPAESAFLPPAPPKESRATEASVRPMGAREEREWQRCKQHYLGLSVDELEILAADYEDLTSIARQALREEMRSRGMGDPGSETHAPTNEDASNEDVFNNPLLTEAEARAQNAPASNAWWVTAYETADREQAEQYAIMLSDVGVESRWRKDPFGANILEVAADQADEARRVLAQPIPQAVIDESKIKVPEWVMPKCPQCGIEEPTLMGTEPSNQWHCDACGNEWTDPVLEPRQG